MKIDEEKYKEAKKIFVDNYCIIKTTSKKKEFEKYNAPKNIILLWVKERIKYLLSGIYSDNVDIYIR